MRFQHNILMLIYIVLTIKLKFIFQKSIKTILYKYIHILTNITIKTSFSYENIIT